MAADLIRIYTSAGTVQATAHIARISPSTCEKRLRRANRNYVRECRRRRPFYIGIMIEYMEGALLQQLARRHGLSYSTLRRGMCRIHPEYVRLCRGGTALAAAAAALRRYEKSPRRCAEIRDWLSANMIEIMDAEAAAGASVIGQAEEARRSRRETGFRTDFRDDSISASAYAQAVANGCTLARNAHRKKHIED